MSLKLLVSRTDLHPGLLLRTNTAHSNKEGGATWMKSWHLLSFGPPSVNLQQHHASYWSLFSLGEHATGRSLASLSAFTYQGFHSGGKGATMPSLASHRSSGSLSGSMPISLAYSLISDHEQKTENWYERLIWDDLNVIVVYYCSIKWHTVVQLYQILSNYPNSGLNNTLHTTVNQPMWCGDLCTVSQKCSSLLTYIDRFNTLSPVYLVQRVYSFHRSPLQGSAGLQWEQLQSWLLHRHRGKMQNRMTGKRCCNIKYHNTVIQTATKTLARSSLCVAKILPAVSETPKDFYVLLCSANEINKLTSPVRLNKDAEAYYGANY